MKSLYLLSVKFSLLMFACTSSKPYFPNKSNNLSAIQYETYTKKLKKDYYSEDHYGIAFYLDKIFLTSCDNCIYDRMQ